jgi:hypothetical protein
VANRCLALLSKARPALRAAAVLACLLLLRPAEWAEATPDIDVRAPPESAAVVIDGVSAHQAQK